MTFEEAFVLTHHCDVRSFRRRVFWSCIPGPAVPAMAMLHFIYPGYCRADFNLITGVAEAQSVDEIRRELRYYFAEPANRRWSRRVAKVRLSARRMIRLARNYLPESTPGHELRYL